MSAILRVALRIYQKFRELLREWVSRIGGGMYKTLAPIADPETCFPELISESLLIFIAGVLGPVWN